MEERRDGETQRRSGGECEEIMGWRASSVLSPLSPLSHLFYLTNLSSDAGRNNLSIEIFGV